MSRAAPATSGRKQPFVAAFPCPICGGHRGLPQHRGERCHGFLSDDGRYAFCSREEFAGTLPEAGDTATYAHRLEHGCRCGAKHEEPSEANIRRFVSFPEDAPKPWRIPDADVEMVHPYRLGGVIQFEVCRIWEHARPRYRGTKTFPRHRGDDGGWYFGQGRWKGRQDKPLYRQDETLNELRLGGKVFFCEGERDADAIWDAGLIGTCNPDGAGSLKRAQGRVLIEAMTAETIDGEVVCAAEIDIVRDNDAAGLRHAQGLYRMLAIEGGMEGRVRIVRPPSGVKDAAALIKSSLRGAAAWN